MTFHRNETLPLKVYTGFNVLCLLDSICIRFIAALAKGHFIWSHSSEDFANIVSWALVVCFITKQCLQNLLNYGH